MSITPEIYRPVSIQDIPSSGKTISINGTAEERESVAKRLGLEALNRFEGNIKITPGMGRQFTTEGLITAEIVQLCVVSGEPMTTELSFELARSFAEDADPFAGLNIEEDELSDPEDEGPDPIIDRKIDLGEAAVEELALQIPPYPRRPDAPSVEIIEDVESEESAENPFAALQSLKNKLESDS